jgi:hypothetical protein
MLDVLGKITSRRAFGINKSNKKVLSDSELASALL